MRILIAEDEPGSKLLRRPIEQLGHDCIHVESNQEALELFEDMKPDLVITDLEKPRIDGEALCRHIRSQRTDQYVYVLMAVDGPQHIRRALECGADDFLLKPQAPEALDGRLVVAERSIAIHRRMKETRIDLDRLNHDVYEEGRRDSLTKVGNRLRLEQDLDALAGRAKRYGHSFSVLLCDLDFLKKYNDTCGMKAGDDTLRSVARTIASFGRSGDMAYRYAGAQFFVVLPEQPLERALIAAERRRAAVEKLGIPNPASPFGVVTISTGIAAFSPTDNQPLEHLLRRAEEALVKAKASGRNQIYVNDRDRASLAPPSTPTARTSSTPP